MLNEVQDQSDTAQLRRALEVQEALETLKLDRPFDCYDPHPGQLAFHRSTHRIRTLFPGNGFGKTTAGAAECHAWCTHLNRWQETPAWPVMVVWACPDFKQFDKLRTQIEADIIGKNARWVADKNKYVYPGGDEFYIISCDRSWKYIQGINPDLFVFDEEPPAPLWRESQMRRRGRRDTRYVVIATATKGITWMSKVLYEPWKKHHRDAGMDEDQGIAVQTHPSIFCIPKGSARDNPGVSEDQWEAYQTVGWTSDKERQVRLFGGFQSWVGDAVYDGAGVEYLLEMQDVWAEKYGHAKIGSLIPKFKGDRIPV